MNYPAQFCLSERAKLAIEAALSAHATHCGEPHWSSEDFGRNAAAWLVDMGLMPVHIEPDEFRRFIARQVADMREI